MVRKNEKDRAIRRYFDASDERVTDLINATCFDGQPRITADMLSPVDPNFVAKTNSALGTVSLEWAPDIARTLHLPQSTTMEVMHVAGEISVMGIFAKCQKRAALPDKTRAHVLPTTLRGPCKYTTRL